MLSSILYMAEPQSQHTSKTMRSCWTKEFQAIADIAKFTDDQLKASDGSEGRHVMAVFARRNSLLRMRYAT